METMTAKPTHRVASYTIFPTGYDHLENPERDRWLLAVVDAGDGWAIRCGNLALNFAGQWEYEPPPGAREGGFLHRCRDRERAALLWARRMVDQLEVGGRTFEELVADSRIAAVEQAKQYLEIERGAAGLKRVLARMGR